LETGAAKWKNMLPGWMASHASFISFFSLSPPWVTAHIESDKETAKPEATTVRDFWLVGQAHEKTYLLTLTL
jgi:hypothetical protein